MTGSILALGSSALLTFQRKLETVSHNIANVNTDGYSKQQTELVTNKSFREGDQFFGSGVKTGVTKRYVDKILNEVLQTNLSLDAEETAYLEVVSRMNTLLSDGNTGIAQAFNEFFDSLQSLANEPGSIPSRQVFLGKTDLVVKRFRSVDSQIDKEFIDINEKSKSLVDQLNAHTKSLVELNRNILSASSLGPKARPNDMLDSRDKVLDEISKIIDITTIEQGDGMVNVYIGQGQNLVIGTQQSVLTAIRNTDDPKKYDIFDGEVNLTAAIVGGQFGALQRVRTEVLEKVQNELGRLAISIAHTFNAQHKKGLDLNGDLGANLFKDVNDSRNTTSRVFADSSNNGTAVVSVLIDDFPRPDNGPHFIDSLPGNLSAVGSLTTLSASAQLQINNVNIRATVPTDDIFSLAADRTASAIAIAAAVNDTTNVHNVTAIAQTTNLYLGAFTAGAFTGSEFQINGQNIISTGANSQTLQRDINALQGTTGVEAFIDENNNIILAAADGRNIQIDTTGASAATFSNFATNGGSALSLVQRAAVRLTATNNSININGTATSNAGFTIADHPQVANDLKTDEYTLTYNGTNFTLIRNSDSKMVAQDANIGNISVDGFTLQQLSGSFLVGDKFVLRPTRNASGQMDIAITDLNKIAMGFPVRAEGNFTNKGTGIIRSEKIKIIDTSGTPATTATRLGNAFGIKGKLTPPIMIKFDNATTYRVYDITNGEPGLQIGPEQSFVANQENNIFPISSVLSKTGSANAPYTYDPGYRIILEGEPEEGDEFTISFNSDATSDGRNAREFIEMREEKLVAAGTITYQQTYNVLISDIGSTTNQSIINSEAADSLLRQTEARKQSLVGVNLDEEASSILKYQQAYQAAAQLITVGRYMFDDLLSALRR